MMPTEKTSYRSAVTQSTITFERIPDNPRSVGFTIEREGEDGKTVFVSLPQSEAVRLRDDLAAWVESSNTTRKDQTVMKPNPVTLNSSTDGYPFTKIVAQRLDSDRLILRFYYGEGAEPARERGAVVVSSPPSGAETDRRAEVAQLRDFLTAWLDDTSETDADIYYVQSETDPTRNYKVRRFRGGRWDCTCPDHANRDRNCKHIVHAGNAWAGLNEPTVIPG